MSANPTVSVVIPFFNAESFIQEAVESVLAQTYTDWELLLVDDGSNDRSTEIALEYARVNPTRIRYLEHYDHLNCGISASRNLGISSARGEFIAILDADDVWLERKLENQLALMRQNRDVALVFGPVFIWQGATQKAQRLALPSGRVPRGEWLITLLGCDGSDALPSSVVMRKDFAQKVGGFEDAFRGIYEDLVMWIKASLNGMVYHDDKECVALYRCNPSGCCASTNAEQTLVEQVRFYKWVAEYVKQHHGPEFNSRLPARMARCNLATTLLQIANRPASRRYSVLLKSTDLLRDNRQALGAFFSILLLLSAVCPQAGSAVFEGIFAFSRLTYSHGLRHSVYVIPQYSLRTIRALVPQPFKRAIKRVFRFRFRFASG